MLVLFAVSFGSSSQDNGALIKLTSLVKHHILTDTFVVHIIKGTVCTLKMLAE